MLKSKKTKIIIGALILLCVLVASSIWVMSSMKSNSVEDFDYSLLAESASLASSNTQIDNIIKNSLSADTDESEDYDTSMYYIYVITPDGKNLPDVIKDFMTTEVVKDGEGIEHETDSFKKIIINENRTIDEYMSNGKIKLVVRTIAQLNAMEKSALATEIGKADLIYMYKASEGDYESGSSLMGDDLYEILTNYITDKPMIIDYELGNTGANDDIVVPPTPTGDNTGTNVYKLTTQDFKNSWKRTQTVNVSTWTDLDNPDDTFKEYFSSIWYNRYSLSKVPGGYDTWNDYWMRNAQDNGAGANVSTLNMLYIYGDTAPTFTDLETWLNTEEGKKKLFARNSAVSDMPEQIKITAMRADSVSNNTLYNGTVQLYDYILIAPDTYTSYDISASESNNVYASLKTLSTSTASGVTYILFGTLPTGSGSGSGSGSSGGSTPPTENLKFNTDTNYGRLLDMVITTTGYSKNSSVLVVGLDFMDTLAARPNNNQTKVSKIVSLINKNRFRTNSGSGSGGVSGKTSTTAFRVLELQPCYPIDLDVAYNNTSIVTTHYYSGKYPRHGNYYTVPGNVVNGVSEDEVGENIEYYQWDLSVAKLSYALGIPAENIELVQMSTSEFITSKADVTTAYDLIYIGGNKSAIKPSSWFGYVRTETSAISSYLTTPSMYFHNGDYVETTLIGTGPDQQEDLYTNGEYQYTRLNGNDLTYDRLRQLEEYVDSGLPIVVGSELWDRYDEATNILHNPRTSAFLDVESNMYTLLKYLDQKKTDGKDNVLLGWENKVSRAVALTRWKAGISDDSNKNSYLSEYYVEVRQSQVNTGQTFTTRKIDNSQGVYGGSSTVTVWNDTLNSELARVALRDGYLRPKYEVTTNAVGYTSNDENTLLKTKDLESGKYLYWTINLVNVDASQLTPGRYYAVLLKDKNDNAEFDLATEQVTSIDLSKGNKLTYEIDSAFWGAVSWQIVVVDTLYTDGKITEQALSTSTSDITCIARENKPKKSATILEIMPLTLADNGTYNKGRSDSVGIDKGDAHQDGHSLYLDINYQQASGNDFLYSSLDDTGYYKTDKIITDGITYKYSGSVGGGGYAFSTHAGNFYVYQNLSSSQYLRGAASNVVQLGLYQPHLGLNQYDTVNNREDWGYNYVDEIADDYDLTLDIMYLDDIEYYSYMAATLTDDERTKYKEEATDARDEYMQYIQQNYGKTYTNIGDDIDPYINFANKENKLKQLIQGYINSTSGTDKYILETAYSSGDYFKIFYTQCIGGNVPYNMSNPNIAAILQAYEDYRVLNDAKITAYRAWRHYSLLSYGPDEFLRRNYDVICFGFLDDMEYGYDYSDNACKAFQAFLNPPKIDGVPDDEQLQAGSVLMTHDSISKFENNKYCVNFSDAMRELIGMDRFHFTEDSSCSESFVAKMNPELSDAERTRRGLTDDAVYRNYMTNRYYVSSIATDYNFGKTDSYSATEWKQQSDAFVTQGHDEYWGNTILGKISLSNMGKNDLKIGYTGLSNVALMRSTGAVLGQTYTYEESEVTKQMEWNVDPAMPLRLTGTTRAVQVNRGIVTTYPYYIKSDLKISPTHCQTLALDLEDDTVTAWYTLAGDNSIATKDSNGKDIIVSLSNYNGTTIDYGSVKKNSSVYAASPKDGMNNYYIYSKGNVTYCGAGHAAITGPSRNNNDERRLFINVLVNLVNKSTYTEPVSKPDIALYDPDGTLAPNGTVVKQDITGEYYIDVTSVDSYPEFGFSMIDLEPGQLVTDIQIYYDLDYVQPASGAKPDNDYHENDSHVLIPIPGKKSDLIDYLNTKENGKNSIYQITSINWPGMVTQKSYFEKYDNKYTYIVIKVTLSGQTEPVYKRIRINLKEQLLDLT